MLDFLLSSCSLSEFAKATFQFVCTDASIELEKSQVLEAVDRFLKTELTNFDYEVNCKRILNSSNEEMGQLMYDMWAKGLEFPAPDPDEEATGFLRKLAYAYISFYYERLLLATCKSKTIGNSSYKIVKNGDGSYGIQETFYDEKRGLIKDENGFDCPDIEPLLRLLEDIQEENEVISLFSEDSLFMFLAKFCIKNKWTNDPIMSDRVAALFAAVCMYHDIKRDSLKMKLLLKWLYDLCKASDCIPYQSFMSYMLRLL